MKLVFMGRDWLRLKGLGWMTGGVLFLFSVPSVWSDDLRRAILIEKTDWGKSLVRELKASQGAEDITSQRREHKSVISIDTADEIFLKLGITNGRTHPVVVPGGGNLEFQIRNSHMRSGFSNGTFTIYGRAAIFHNDGNLLSKIRLRVRIYLDVSDNFSNVERSQSMPDWAFLEIKIKNPTPSEKGGSNKYRVRIHDSDMLLLFRSDPFSPFFSDMIEEIKKRTLTLYNNPSQQEKSTIRTVFDVIKNISQLQYKEEKVGLEFLRPLAITSYIRDSYSFKERDYPFPIEVGRGSEVTGLMKLWPFRKKTRIEIRPKKMEYQLTVDHNIRVFLPKIDSCNVLFDLPSYFDPHSSNVEASYPRRSVAIEFKEPIEIALLPFHFRSPLHQYLTRELARKMRRNILTGYQVDRGKAGHLFRALSQVISESDIRTQCSIAEPQKKDPCYESSPNQSEPHGELQ